MGEGGCQVGGGSLSLPGVTSWPDTKGPGPSPKHYIFIAASMPLQGVASLQRTEARTHFQISFGIQPFLPQDRAEGQEEGLGRPRANELGEQRAWRALSPRWSRGSKSKLDEDRK